MSTIIKYNNASKILADGKTATLQCKDKMMLTDVVIESPCDSSGIEFNIAYGDTPPEDTSKLWVKCVEPKDSIISPKVESLSYQMENGVTIIAMPSIRPAVQVGSKVLFYNGYGYRSHTDTYAQTFEQTGHIYDLETDTFSSWSVSNQSTQYYEYSTGVCVNDTGYLCGGYSLTRYIYDAYIRRVMPPNTTATGASFGLMDTTKAYCAAAAVDSNIYIFGGISRTGSYSFSESLTTTSIHMADTMTGDITKLSTTYNYGYKAAAANVDGKIYLFGGGYKAANKGTLEITDNIAVFDATTHNITILEQKLPDIALGISGIAVGSKIYLFGGRWGTSQNMSKDIYVFETTTGELTLVGQMASAGETIMLALWNNYIYMLTGYGEWNGYRSTVDRMSLTVLLDEGKLLIETGVNKNTFSLINTGSANVEVGTNHVYLGNSEGYAEKVPAYLYKDGEWIEI
jgi:hypothetical protein